MSGTLILADQGGREEGINSLMRVERLEGEFVHSQQAGDPGRVTQSPWEKEETETPLVTNTTIPSPTLPAYPLLPRWSASHSHCVPRQRHPMNIRFGPFPLPPPFLFAAVPLDLPALEDRASSSESVSMSELTQNPANSTSCFWRMTPLTAIRRRSDRQRRPIGNRRPLPNATSNGPPTQLPANQYSFTTRTPANRGRLSDVPENLLDQLHLSILQLTLKYLMK